MSQTPTTQSPSRKNTSKNTATSDPVKNTLAEHIWPEGSDLNSFFDSERRSALAVDLSQYQYVNDRDVYQPIISRTNRHVALPVAKAYVTKALKKTPSPVMMTHIVTTRCNYSCGFCSFADTLNAKTNELSLDEIEKVYHTIGSNLNVIVYSGGETTINKDLPEIIEAAYRLTSVKSVYIISNAWKPDLLFKITHQVMQRCPGLHLTWSLSIEGPKEHNNKTRHTQNPNWDAWQNTVDTLFGLKAIRERYGYHELDVQLCTVCTPDNAHLMQDWYTTVRDVLQPDKWNLNLMRRSVQMTGSDLATFDERRKRDDLEPFERTYLDITNQVCEDVLAGKLKFLYHTNSQYDGALKSAVDLISQSENCRTLLEEEETFCCQAGSFGAFIGSEGEVSGCEEFAMNPTDTKLFGNLRESGYDFQAIWHSDKADDYRQKVGNAPECRGCTLESQRNYPSILLSFKTLTRAVKLARHITA